MVNTFVFIQYVWLEA